MKRFALIAAALVLAVLPARPTAALTDDVCAGFGTMVTGSPVTEVGIGPAVNTTWAFELFLLHPTLQGCAGQYLNKDPSLTAIGVFTGWCDYSTGRGVTDKGQQFAWIGIGYQLVLTGGLTGRLNFVPDVTSGDSCAVGTGADRFLAWGGGLLWSCKAAHFQGTVPGAAFDHSYDVCV